MLYLSTPLSAANIDSAAALAQNSEISESALYILNPGVYAVTAAVNIASDARSGLALRNAATSLTVNNTLTGGAMFSLGQLTVSNGTLNAQGGAASNTLAVQARGLTLSGGTLTAQGGTGMFSYGISVTQSGFTMNGGTADIRAGGGRYADGMRVQGGMSVAGGTLTATGAGGNYPTQSTSHGILVTSGGFTLSGAGAVYANGSQDSTNTHGIVVNNIGFRQDGGELHASGGSKNNAKGLVILAGSFTQAGGLIAAAGGSDQFAYGIHSQVDIVQTGGRMEATGGSTDYAYGIATPTSMRQSATNDADSVIVATGGAAASGNAAFGISVTGNFTQNGGTLEGHGGDGVIARGFSVGRTLTQERGSIAGTGGGRDRSHGIYSALLIQNGGSITGTGGNGSDDNVHGIYAVTLNQYNGSIAGTGGTGAGNAHAGIFAPTLTQNSGIIHGTGGNGPGAGHNGVTTTGVLTQNGGEMYATGGGTAGDAAYGVWAQTLAQNYGYINAVGGAGALNNGLYINGSAAIAGALRLVRNDAAASVYVNSNDMILKGTAIVEPVVDIAKPPGYASGLIQTVAGGTITIEPGALVQPWFLDSRNMARGVEYVSSIFIDTDGGTINGEFANSGGGLTIVYTLEKTADGRYTVTYERERELEEVLFDVPCENARALLQQYDDLLDSNPGNELMRNIIAFADHSQSMADLHARAAHIGKTLTPQAYTKITQTLIRTMDLPQLDLFRQLDARIGQRKNIEHYAAAPGAVASLSAASGGDA